MPLRIANAAGFLGDNLDAPRRLVESAEVDFLTLEYLAELTLSILARQREKDPSAGYASDFIPVLESLCPALLAQTQLRLVTNAGGVNPASCAQAAAGVLMDHGLEDDVLAVVTGDDLLPWLGPLQSAGWQFENLESGQPLSSLEHEVVSANAYLGAVPIIAALNSGARYVITGRVADASLTVGPAAHRYRWKVDDWDCLAGASVAGHLIECGAQVTGGYSTRCDDLRLTDVGYPIAEVAEDGSCVITKPAGSGGVVDRLSVTEQLVYEIGDPKHYLTPDVDVDFTTVNLTEEGVDRVAVSGATGRPHPNTYKVSLAYRDGYMANGMLLVDGRDCVARARTYAKLVFDRVALAGFELQDTRFECLGAGVGVPGLHEPPSDAHEVVLRLSAHDSRREAVERFTRELAPLITSAPAGIAGYAGGLPRVQPVFAYWPTTVPRDALVPQSELRPAKEWL